MGIGLLLMRSGLAVHRTSERRGGKGGGASSPELAEPEVPASKLLKLTKNALALHQWTLRQLEREAVWFWSPQRALTLALALGLALARALALSLTRSPQRAEEP